MKITIEGDAKEIAAFIELLAQKNTAKDIMIVIKENLADITSEVSGKLAESLTACYSPRDIS